MTTYPHIKLDGATSTNGDRDQWLINLAAAHNNLASRYAELQTYAYRQGETVERHSHHIETLQDAVLTLQEKIIVLEGTVDDLVDRALTAELAAAPKLPRPRDDTNDRIVAYLRDKTPGQWLNPSSIAVNLGLGGKSVAGRLDRLARDSKVERTGGKGSGTDPLYRVVPEAIPGAEE